MRILYLEDNSLDADLVRRELARQDQGDVLDVATTLSEARVRLDDGAYDVVVADLHVPDGSGLELVAELRARALPAACVVLTSHGDESTAVAALKAGADDYQPKLPGFAAQLRRTLEVAVERFRHEHARRQGLLRVLYAEHHGADIDLTLRHLAYHAPHIRCDVVHTSAQVLAKLPATPQEECAYDVVLLDYRLPGENALDVLRTICVERALRVPVVIVTGQGDEDVAAQTLRLGATDYLVKHTHYLFQLPVAIESAHYQAALVRERDMLRASAEERQRLTERLSHILESISDAYFTVDRDWRLTYLNAATERVLDQAREQLLGRVVWEAFPQVVGTPLEIGAREAMASRRPYVFEDVQTPLGKWLEARAYPLDEGLAVYFRDITARRDLEAQLLRAQRMESLGTLAGGIAHDLNNVLAPILLSTELLRAGEQDADRLSLIETVAASARRGADMVGQVLSFARGMGGRRVDLAVGPLLREVEKFANETFLKTIEVRTVMPADLWHVTGDSTQLHQLLLNLCVNARDAMPDGGTLTLAASNVVLDARPDADGAEAIGSPCVCLEVSDTGPGIAPELLGRIFEPFFTTKDVGKGTGLGLSTSLAIAEGHGGSIQVQSQAGRGATFRVYLPAASAHRLAASETAVSPPPRGRGELVLVVDDEASVRTVTSQTLETFGYRVLVAADGQEALALLTARRHDVAVAFVDMMMPGMDGPATIRALRRVRPDLPVIGVSGLGPSRRGGAPVDVALFLAKPYSAETLLAGLHRVLRPA
jgi:two-component system cell cycle sensor histidine kinase/response regulator CckA